MCGCTWGSMCRRVRACIYAILRVCMNMRMFYNLAKEEKSAYQPKPEETNAETMANKLGLVISVSVAR